MGQGKSGEVSGESVVSQREVRRSQRRVSGERQDSGHSLISQFNNKSVASQQQWEELILAYSLATDRTAPLFHINSTLFSSPMPSCPSAETRE